MKILQFLPFLAITKIAYATPSARDAYGDDISSDWSIIAFWIVIFGAGWIFKKVTKSNLDIGECAGFIFFILAFGALILGIGYALMKGFAEKPFVIIAAIAFYWWFFKHNK